MTDYSRRFGEYTVAAENGDCRRKKRQKFVAFLVTIVTVIVAKCGVLEKATYMIYSAKFNYKLQTILQVGCNRDPTEIISLI